MEIGSVKFWRRMIVGTVVGIIVLFMVLAIYFCIRTFTLSSKIEKLDQQLSAEVEAAEEAERTRDDETEAAVAQALEEYKKQNAEESFEYQDICPELYTVNAPKTDNSDEKIVYMTFDDGPDTKTTPEILDILDEYDIKATFFVSAQFGDEEFRARMFNEVLDRGHALGIHTYTHDYADVYDSVDNYLEDMNKIFQEVWKATGVKPTLMRFPGGSVNNHDGAMYQNLIAEVTRRGFTYHDWSVSSEDSAGDKLSSSQIADRIIDGCTYRNKSIVLCHDTNNNSTTVGALRQVIETLTDKGYEFRALDNTVKPYHFPYKQ